MLSREVFVIKKLTAEDKLWLFQRNKKRLRLRTQKRIWTKQRRAWKIEKYKEAKQTYDYSEKRRQFEFHAPDVFSFALNPDETNAFFTDIISFITRRENFGRSLFIDISKIEKLTIDALMYLLAIVNNLNGKFRNKYSFSGNAPNKPAVNKMFSESGFYHFVRYQGTEPITRNKDNLQIVSGEKSETQIAKKMSDFVCSKAGVTRLESNFIYIMMIELNCTLCLCVISSYSLSHATLSCTLPAVTSTPNTKPLLSHAVCASYANCLSCSPFTNIPLSGSVVETVFSIIPPPVGF